MTDDKTLSENTKEIVLSRNPERALQETMQIITALKAIYAEENKALSAVNTKKFSALQPKKMDIFTQYQSAVKQIVARQKEFLKVRSILRAHLIEAQKDLALLTATNIVYLERVHKSATRLGNRIVIAARDAVRKDSVNYGATGNMSGSARAISLGVNQSA